MVRYYCDICGRETDSLTTYQIPHINYEAMGSPYGFKRDIMVHDSTIRTIEICECCAVDICDLIEVYEGCKGSMEDTIRCINQKRTIM